MCHLYTDRLPISIFQPGSYLPKVLTTCKIGVQHSHMHTVVVVVNEMLCSASSAITLLHAYNQRLKH